MVQNVELERVKVLKMEVEVYNAQGGVLFKELTTFPDVSMFNIYTIIEDYFTELLYAIRRLYFAETHHMISPYSDPNNKTVGEDFKSIEPITESVDFERMGRGPYETEVTKKEFILGPSNDIQAKFVKKMCREHRFVLDHRMCVFFSFIEQELVPDVEFYVKAKGETEENGEERKLSLVDKMRNWVKTMLQKR